MKIYPVVVCVAALAVAGAAGAHAHLESSTPANHSTLAVAPANVALRFHEPVQLTALSIQAENTKPQKLAPLPSATSSSFSVPLPPLGPGSYVITWRALSDDGHVMSDRIAFTIQPGAAPAK